jgi:putative endonuclease
MSFERQTSGRAGEDAAVSFLKKHGYKVIDRNFQNNYGEMDIIALDGDVLCFIEVKTRQSEIYGSPFEAVTRWKQRKLVRVAESYLKYKHIRDPKARFDVVGVVLGESESPSIELIQGAFEAD